MMIPFIQHTRTHQKTFLPIAMLLIVVCDGSTPNPKSNPKDSEKPLYEVGSELDINDDGSNDGVAVDTTGDGLVDGLDTNGDGQADFQLVDSNGDGNVDGWDVDGNGSADFDLSGNPVDDWAGALGPDNDLDGVTNSEDAFPNDPSETLDSDGDGVGDNSDAFPGDAGETQDSDGDGVGDNGDACPNDPNGNETDADADGFCENAAGFGGGEGSVANPYIINTAEQLEMLNSNLSLHYTLNNDIDLNGVSWEPVGNTWDTTCDANTASFSGAFDGNGHTLSDLTLNDNRAGCYGLFGKIDGGFVRNLYLNNFSITSTAAGIQNYAGILAGQVLDGTISDVHVTGLAQVSAQARAGGLVGYVSNAAFSNCSSSADATVVQYTVGGLVGLLGYGATINRCFATGDTTSGAATNGGLVGLMIDDVHVSNSFATGAVNGSTAHTAGLVGELRISGSITNSYSIGAVSGITDGGLLEEDSSGIGVFTANFWDTQTSGQSTSVAATGRTTAQMKSAATFTSVGWDFIGEATNGSNDVWSIDSAENCGYPYLTALGPADFTCP